MKCRTMTEDGTIVWFGSSGVDQHGNAKFVNDTHDSYSYDADGTTSSLNQRLSVLKGELWNDIEYGLPLTDKVRTKMEMDLFIIQAILSHENVVDIKNFESKLEKMHYSCNMKIVTIYGDLDMSL